MKKKTKIIIITLLISVFSAQVLTNAYEKGIARGKYLYQEKMAALKVSAVLAERSGMRDDIRSHYNLLADSCRDTINTAFIPQKAKRQAQRLLAEAKMKTGDTEEALQICDELLQKNPNDKATLKVKAKIYRTTAEHLVAEGRIEEAVRNYQDIIGWDITPEMTAFYKSLIATTYFQQGNLDEAEKWFLKMKEDHADQRNAPALACVFLANIALFRNDKEKAKGYFREVIAKYPYSEWSRTAVSELEKIK